LEDITEEVVPEPVPDQPTDDMVLPCGKPDAPPPKRRRGPAGSSGDGGAGGGPAHPPPPLIDVPAPAPPTLPAAHPTPPGSPGSPNRLVLPAPEDDDIVFSDPEPPEVEAEEEPGRRAKRPDVNFHAGFDGFFVRYDHAYVNPNTGVAFTANWQIRCKTHPGCIKSRGVTLKHTADCGAIEPLAFLYAWTVTPPLPGKTHRNSPPAQAAVAAFAEAHREDLEALVRAFVPA
jgi:hypothetical protein